MDALIIKPTVSHTVPVRIDEGEETTIHHITQGQFERGNAPGQIDRRFDLWSNLAGEEVRIIPLREESSTESTVFGRGEIQQTGETKVEGDVVEVIFADGGTERYVIEEEGMVRVPLGANPARDDEAKILFQCYFGGISLEELTFKTAARDRKKRRDDRLERAMKQSFQEGVVETEDGRRVEPDHPDSPLRKAGMI